MVSGVFAALLGLTVAGFVVIGITTCFLGVAHPETRFTVSILVLLIAALVTFTPLLLVAATLEARAALQGKPK